MMLNGSSVRSGAVSAVNVTCLDDIQPIPVSKRTGKRLVGMPGKRRANQAAPGAENINRMREEITGFPNAFPVPRAHGGFT